MIIEPNTPNQIRVEDPQGDILMVDTFSDCVIVTIKDHDGGYRAVYLDPRDVFAVLAHFREADATLPIQKEG